MKSALVHDWLVGVGGGEKCLEAIWELFPSPIYTLVKNPLCIQDLQCAQAEIHTSFLQKFPKAKTAYRNYLPFFPYAVEQFDLSAYDLVLSLSHAVAKGALTHSEQLHICYCFTPMRYAWDLSHQYLENLRGLKKFSANLVLHRLRAWDVASIGRVDHFVAISHTVAQRIRKIYNRESTVIYPPVATHLFSTQKKEEYYVTASRLVPYKKIDLIVEAFSQMPDKKLVVIGDGPEMHKVKAKATKNIEILGHVPDAELHSHLARAKAFVFAALEDFGIIVVEAQASGTPIIAFGKGASRETVVDGKTGIFFAEQIPSSIISSVQEFERTQDRFDPHAIKAHAETFNEERFKQEFRTLVNELYKDFHESRHLGRGKRHPALARL